MPYGVTGKHDGRQKEVLLRRFESGYGYKFPKLMYLFFTARREARSNG